MCSSPLPYVRFACASYFFASLHLSSNHGASVFPHLLGFVGCDSFISFTIQGVLKYYIVILTAIPHDKNKLDLTLRFEALNTYLG